MNSALRLPALSLATKVTLTLFLALVGSGYLVAATKIYVWHEKADGRAGMTPDDLMAVYHGLEREASEEELRTMPSEMLQAVRPDGVMYKNLKPGGERAIRALTRWLEEGAKEETFAEAGLFEAGDPSAREVIAARCVVCHHANGGDKEDLPYAEREEAEPQYELVAEAAKPPIDPDSRMVVIEPTSARELLHVTHAHILAIPVFTLIVAVMFLMTGLSAKIKLILAPLPMLATCLDFASWWLARSMEPFVYVIAASGALFGITYGLQIFCVLGSLWFGKAGRQADAPAVA